MMSTPKEYMEEAATLALRNVRARKGGPFGAVIVKGGRIIARGTNLVTSTNDPSAHAEVVAIRRACKVLKSFQLEGCDIYCSCEPCPMCLGAIYWARPRRVFFANTKADAARIGFDDSFIYAQIKVPPARRKLKMTHLKCPEAGAAFAAWQEMANKVEY